MNNYNNGYYNNPYGGQSYYNPNYNQNYNTMQNYNNNLNNQSTGFEFVNGIEEAKKYIVNPNKTMYLKDLSSNMIFIKKCDNQGRYTLQAYELTELNQDPTTEFVKKDDFNELVASVNNLSKMVENFVNKPKNDFKMQTEKK